jgi:hypothetical protein
LNLAPPVSFLSSLKPGPFPLARLLAYDSQ